MLREAESDYYYGRKETALREQFASAHFRFAFVRNPVSRLVSLYANKVLDQNDLGVSEAVRNELRDFDAFIDWRSSPFPGSPIRSIALRMFAAGSRTRRTWCFRVVWLRQASGKKVAVGSLRMVGENVTW